MKVCLVSVSDRKYSKTFFTKRKKRVKVFEAPHTGHAF